MNRARMNTIDAQVRLNLDLGRNPDRALVYARLRVQACGLEDDDATDAREAAMARWFPGINRAVFDDIIDQEVARAHG